MSDKHDLTRPESYDDLELVADYLNKHLDPEKVALVERRLAEDPAFREFAAPLTLVWRTPMHLERHPRPPGELEKHWDEFTKRAGFVHQRNKARRRRLRIIAIVTLALGLAAFLFRDRIRTTYEDIRDYETVASGAGTVTLRNGTRVQLEPGAVLRARRLPRQPDMEAVKLKGSARFLVARPPSSGLLPSPQVFAVFTPAGMVVSGSAEFIVTSHGDTTEVQVLRRARDPNPRDIFDQMPDFVLLFAEGFEQRQISLFEGERGRIRRGVPAEKLPAAGKQP